MVRHWFADFFSFSDDFVKGLVKQRAHRGRVRMDGDDARVLVGGAENDPRASPIENTNSAKTINHCPRRCLNNLDHEI
jgi:hypothetical protein